MSDFPTYSVPQQWSDSAWIDETTYEAMYRQSVEIPISFGAIKRRSF